MACDEIKQRAWIPKLQRRILQFGYKTYHFQYFFNHEIFDDTNKQQYYPFIGKEWIFRAC
jgi:hypothetical protein